MIPPGTPDLVHPGDVLAQKYRVERVLGSGGTGLVVAAIHLENGKRVALKILLPSAMSDTEVVGRFLREARASVRLRSEHVARVFEAGTLEGAIGTPYMVMEYLEGSDLRSIVRRGPLRVDEAVGFVIQACTAIEEAHGLGIIHRDLKPENLFLTRRPDGSPLVKVLDFGISKMPLGGGEMELTSVGTVRGTPFYMAPEQMRSMAKVTVRSDIWGMGTVLYELIAGRRAFNGLSIPDICAQVIINPAPPLPEAPPELEQIVLRCLQKDPAQRFASMSELAAALAPFATGARVSSPPPRPSGLPPAPMPSPAMPSGLTPMPSGIGLPSAQQVLGSGARPSGIGLPSAQQVLGSGARPSGIGLPSAQQVLGSGARPSGIGLPSAQQVLGPGARPSGVGLPRPWPSATPMGPLPGAPPAPYARRSAPSPGTVLAIAVSVGALFVVVVVVAAIVLFARAG